MLWRAVLVFVKRFFEQSATETSQSSVLNLKDLSKFLLSSQSSTKKTAKTVVSEKYVKAMLWRAVLVLIKRFLEQSAAENYY